MGFRFDAETGEVCGEYVIVQDDYADRNNYVPAREIEICDVCTALVTDLTKHKMVVHPATSYGTPLCSCWDYNGCQTPDACRITKEDYQS